MTDYIMADIRNPNIPFLKSNFNFNCNLELNSGAVDESRLYCEMSSMRLTIINHRYVKVSGSISKLSTGGKHNAVNLCHADVCEMIQVISEMFLVSPRNIILHNYEHGVVLDSPIEIEDILDSFIFHRGKAFLSSFLDQKIMKVAVHDKYKLKCYDKFSPVTSKNLFRFEVRFNNMSWMNSNSIHTLNDITIKENFATLNARLLTEWNQVILFNPYLLAQNSQGCFDPEWSNPQFWKSLNKDCRYRARQKLRYYLKNQPSNIQMDLESKMRDVLLSSL